MSAKDQDNPKGKQCPECGRIIQSKSGTCRRCQGSGSFRVQIPADLANNFRKLAKKQKRSPRDKVLWTLENYWHQNVIDSK